MFGSTFEPSGSMPDLESGSREEPEVNDLHPCLLVVTVMGVPRMDPEAYQTNVERDMRLDSSRPRIRVPQMTCPRTFRARCVPRIPHSHTTKHSVRRSKEGQKRGFSSKFTWVG